MRKVYLDACIAIYLIEKHPDFGAKVEALIDAMDDGDILCYSPLSRMECLVMPMRKGDADLMALYDSFFSNQEMLAIEPERFDEAAKLRADFTSLKRPTPSSGDSPPPQLR